MLIPLNHVNPALVAELLGGVVIYDGGPGAGGAPLGRRARSATSPGGFGGTPSGYQPGPVYGGYTGLGHGFRPYSEPQSTRRTAPRSVQGAW